MGHDALLVASLVLFVLGSTVAYLVLRPALDVLLGFGGDGVTALLEVTQYLSFITTILIIFGVSFEFPLVIVLLNLAGVLSSDPAPLVAAYRDLPALLCLPGPDRPRTRSRCWRWLCRCLLFELSVLFARWNDKRRARKDAESEWAGLGDDESSPTPAPGQAPLPEHASSTPSELDDS